MNRKEKVREECRLGFVKRTKKEVSIDLRSTWSRRGTVKKTSFGSRRQ